MTIVCSCPYGAEWTGSQVPSCGGKGGRSARCQDLLHRQGRQQQIFFPACWDVIEIGASTRWQHSAAETLGGYVAHTVLTRDSRLDGHRRAYAFTRLDELLN